MTAHRCPECGRTIGRIVDEKGQPAVVCPRGATRAEVRDRADAEAAS